MKKESVRRLRAVGFASGVLGGTFGGLVGLGGGIIMIPLMTWLGALSQHKAHGTSLVAVVCTGAIGAATYSVHGAVDWRVSLILAASATVTARWGALYAHSLPEKKLKKGFGLFFIIASMLLVSKGYFPSAGFEFGFWARAAIFLAVGAVTGFVSGMLGVGGGGVMVPLMVILGGMTQHIAQGTSLLAMVPGGAAGALTHYRLRNVDVQVAGGLIAGAMAGGFLGGTAANMLPELLLKFVFGAFGVWMGVKYLRAGK